MLILRTSVVAVVAMLVAATCLAAGPAINFDRDVRPILSDHCFACHGPDETKREADLRLDTPAGLEHLSVGQRVIVPGRPEQSPLLQRLKSTNPDERMPPAKFGKPLSPRQIALIQSWIEQGAKWEQHWAFVPPQRPIPPQVSHPEWVRNEIDAFVLAQLEREGWKPSPQADPRTLIRRVTLDLTGLPPTPEEIDEFLGNSRNRESSSQTEFLEPQRFEIAYGRLVDRLLASPRYAERMSVRWLDFARYADTNGYQSDGPRDMWRWRDWVLDAFASNMPFDQFTVEQLAGDLLPNASPDQLIATGFNRNHRGNSEGGIVPEEFQVEYVVDRVDTTFTVWLGLTMGCARCHTHKYDPISQHEYYGVFAYFNNVPEYGRAIKEGNSPPYVLAPTGDQRLELERLQAAAAAARNRCDQLLIPVPESPYAALNQHRESLRYLVSADSQRRQLHSAADSQEASLPRELAAWEAKPASAEMAAKAAGWTIDDALVGHFALDGDLENRGRAAAKAPVASLTTAASSESPSPTQQPPGWDGSRPDACYESGRLGQAAEFDGQRYLRLGNVAKFGYLDQFSFGAWVDPSERAAGTILSKMEPEERGAGYSLDLTAAGTVQVNFVKRWLDDSLRIETTEPIPAGEWVHVFVTYDGSRLASGVRIYVNGRQVPQRVNLDAINQTFANDEPLRIGAGQALFQGRVDDVRFYDRTLRSDEVAVLATPDSIQDIIRIPTERRTALQTSKLRQFFLEVTGPEHIRSAWRAHLQAERELSAFVDSLPTVMVMQEMEQPRDTHLLIRGQYDKPGERVSPGVPACFPPLPAAAQPSRLAFAQWLVSPDHPLTARVAVNRFWQNVFGAGLVKTTEDFGSQGERPSHPELLDWLATEFIRTGWDVKRLMKLIVTSSTYRQASGAASSPAPVDDPENRRLARGPRFRLSAEIVRDQALFASGLLDERFGGPSVLPYQPEGLWQELATVTEYPQSHGSDLYRRSLYTYWKRTVPPPMMMTFDTSGRETCEVRQTRTNTPLQALNLLNDVTFVEAARVLAQRLVQSGGSDQDRLREVFLRVISRSPTLAESRVLLSSLNAYRKHYEQNPEQAQQLISTGEFPPRQDVPPHELAAWTAVCSTVLNLDEAVTKE